MRKIMFFTIGLLVMSSLAFADPIDLSGWTAYPGGTWTVASDGSSVLQTTNGAPTYFVSGTNYIDTTFEGSFGVETTSDDDFIGFVFGFNGLEDYLLFDWKQGRQNYSGFASDGFTLSQITGNHVNLWNHSGAGITVLGTSYGDDTNDTGWADNTVYRFTLDYTTTNIRIAINDATIFDVAGTFGNGAFGFYNYSQSQVRYAGFEEDEYVPPNSDPVPEPSTILLMGAGLLGLVGYSRKRSKK